MFSIIGNKNYIKAVLAIWAILLPFCVPLWADDGGGGTASPFVLGAGGRSIGMGGAKAGVWGGSYSLLWNPAGLYHLERGEVNLFHTSLFDESCSYSSLLGSYPFIDMGTISFGMLRLYIGGIERRDSENMLIEGELSNKQTRYIFGYAKDIYKGLSGGLSMKLDRYAQGSYNANGIGMDIGIGFQPEMNHQLIDGSAFGLTLVNVLEPKLKLANEESGDPSGTRAGFAIWRSLHKGFNDRFLLAVDIDKTKYDDTRIHFGCEYLVNSMFAARGGWDSGFPTFGFGFYLYSLQIDYAYRSSDLEDYHLFSLSYGFGPSKTQRLEKRKHLREEEIKREIKKETIRYEASQIENSLSKARKDLKNNRFRSATGYFKTVLLWDPENQEAKAGKLLSDGHLLVITADSLFEAGNYGEALMQYRRGNEYLRADELEARIKTCKGKIGQSANRKLMVESMFTHALELYSDRKWSESIAVFKELLVLEPNLGIVRSYLNKAKARLEEEYSRVLQQIGLLVGKKRYGEALELIRAGLEKYPGYTELEEKLVEVTALKNRTGSVTEKTVKDETDKIALSRDETEKLRLIYEKGVGFFKNGRFDRAIEEWEQVWRRSAEFEKIEGYLVKAYLYWGMELYTKHDYEEAIEIWERIFQVDRDNEKAIRYIRRTREELGKLESVSG